MSNRKIKYHRVNNSRNQVDPIKIVDNNSLKPTPINHPGIVNNINLKIEQNHSKSELIKHSLPLNRTSLVTKKTTLKTLTNHFSKRAKVFNASNNSNISKKSRIISEKKDDTIYIVFVALGFLAMIALVILGLITLGLGYPSGIGYLFLAGLILLTIILIEIIRNRQPSELNNDQIEKQSKFWRGFAAITGVLAVIVITLLLI